MGALSWWHWLIVLLVVILLFGSKKLPDAARGLGQSLRIFKSEVKEMQKDDAAPAPAPQAGPTPPELSPGTDAGTAASRTPDDIHKSA